MDSSLRRCALWLCLTFVVWARSAAASDTTEQGTWRTRWLTNRLRLVTVASPNAGWVSVRLLVRDGTLEVPSEELHLPHVVEHLAFKGLDYYMASSWLVRDGGSAQAWTQDHRVVYEFEVPAADAARLLREMRHQWDAGGFSQEELEKEIRRIQHELGGHTDRTLTMLAMDLAPQSALARSQLLNIRDLEGISAKQAWKHFQETYVGARMTLVLVASASRLDELQGVLQEYGSIPTGQAGEVPRLGDLSWLRGLMEPGSKTHLFGMWFSQPADSPCAIERCMLGEAVSQYVREQVAMRASFAYDVDCSPYEASDATIWMFKPIVNTYVNSAEQAQEAGRCALFALAEDSTWWDDFREPRKVALDADGAVELASLIPHDQPLPGGLPSDYPTARELQRDYRRIVHSAVQFYVVQKRPAATAASEERERGPIAVAALWFIHEIFEAPSWRSPLLLGYVLGLSALVTLILRRATLRAIRAAAARKQTRACVP